MITKKSTATHEEWKALRHKYIGGSDAAAVVGMNAWVSPLTLWAEKTGRLPGFEGNLATEVGTYLEEFVAQKFAQETGKKVRKCNQSWFNDQYPWAIANIDRDIVGEDAGLEIKTTSELNLKSFKGGEYPVNYYTQCQHYMMVTGAEKWYVAVLVLGKAFHVFEIPRDEAYIATLIEAERAFWEEHVACKVPPLPTGSEADGEALNALYPAAEVEDAAMDLGGLEDIVNLRAMKVTARDALQEEIDEIDQQIKAEMGTFERGVSGHWTVRWSNTESRRVDTKALKAKYPKIAEECMKVTAGRRFTVSKVETNEE